jgi:endonuclease/exonuclease/phosphatase family metal-dependent hydrolase
MVLTKYAVEDVAGITFTTSRWYSSMRGFFALNLKGKPQDAAGCVRVIGTHLTHNSKEVRKSQVSEIVAYLATQTSNPLPTVLAGDLNVVRGSAEDQDLFGAILDHSYLGNDPTSTDVMTEKWYHKNPKEIKPDEIIDYVSLFKTTVPGCASGILESSPMIHSFSKDYNTHTALSDHNSVAGRLYPDCS